MADMSVTQNNTSTENSSSDSRFPDILSTVVFKADQKSIEKEKENKLNLLKELILKKYNEMQVKLTQTLKLKESMTQCQSFIDEKVEKLQNFTLLNKYKKLKALEKYKQVKKSRHFLMKKWKKVHADTEVLEQRHRRIRTLIEKMLSHKNFIQRTIDLLPKDYVKTRKDQSIEGLMGRFKSLFYVNEVLFANIGVKNNNLKILKGVETELKSSRELCTIQALAKIKKLYMTKDSVTSRVEEKERLYRKKYSETRKKIKTFGRLLLSLDNLANKCTSFYKLFGIENWTFVKSYLLKTMTIDEKVKKIKEYIDNNLQVVMVIKDNEGISSYFTPIIKRKLDSANRKSF